MSKLWKGVKKVFKKVTKFVKKHWKKIVIAAAIYFTAGIALAAMPSTAAFSAAMPGFGVGGMFSNAAVAMGATGAAGSGIAGTVAAQAAAAAGTAATTTAIAGGVANLPATGAVAAGSAAPAAVAPAAAAVEGAAVVGGAAKAATAGKGIIGAVKGMTAMEKVSLAGTVFKTAGGLLSDSEDDINRKSHKRRFGQSFGKNRKGEGPGWGGAAKDAFAGKFGTAGGVGAEEEGGGDSRTPFESPQVANMDAEPFADMSYSENAAKQDQSVMAGYKNKNYSPVR
jgi:hypothetical protein